MFEPFNLGNTLARAAQINSLQSRNKLIDLQLGRAEKQDQQALEQEAINNQINEVLRNGGGPNELSRLGLPGLNAAEQVVGMRGQLQQLDEDQFEQAVERGRLVNRVATGILNSKNPKQSAIVAMKNPQIRDMLPPTFNPANMEPEELLRVVQEAADETAFFTDPQEISKLLTPEQTTQAGFQQGTVVQQNPDGDLDVLQGPPPKEKGPDPFKAEDRINKKAAENLKTEAGLRKEFNSLVDDFTQVADANARVKAAGENPTGAGDLALIFNFMKMLDPGSTVREGEFANAENSAGIPQRIRGNYNKIVNGERLSEEQRGDFLTRAEELFIAAQTEASKTAEAYEGIATRAGVDPQNILANFEARKQDEPEPLKAPVIDNAPPAAVEFLRQNPQLKEDFIAKYGGLPEGFE